MGTHLLMQAALIENMGPMENDRKMDTDGGFASQAVIPQLSGISLHDARRYKCVN